MRTHEIGVNYFSLFAFQAFVTRLHRLRVGIFFCVDNVLEICRLRDNESDCLMFNSIVHRCLITNAMKGAGCGETNRGLQRVVRCAREIGSE